MRELHPKIKEAAIVIQSWVDAGMNPTTMRDRLSAREGIVANLCCEAAGGKSTGLRSVVAQLVAEVHVKVAPEVQQLLEGDHREMALARLRDPGEDEYELAEFIPEEAEDDEADLEE